SSPARAELLGVAMVAFCCAAKTYTPPNYSPRPVLSPTRRTPHTRKPVWWLTIESTSYWQHEMPVCPSTVCTWAKMIYRPPMRGQYWARRQSSVYLLAAWNLSAKPIHTVRRSTIWVLDHFGPRPPKVPDANRWVWPATRRLSKPRGCPSSRLEASAWTTSQNWPAPVLLVWL